MLLFPIGALYKAAVRLTVRPPLSPGKLEKIARNVMNVVEDHHETSSKLSRSPSGVVGFQNGSRLKTASPLLY
jgi:hypothetical protein